MKTSSKNASRLSLGFVTILGALGAGCEASAPPPPPAAATMAPAPAPAVVPGGTAVNPGSSHPSAFAPATLAAAPNNGTAQPIDPTLAGAAGAILDKVAGNLAPGMSREGAPIAATFQTGQTMEQVIQLQSGRCYTVVAAGPTVQGWDFSLILVANPLPVQPVLLHEAATGTPAAMSGSGNCFKWNFPPVTARVVVQVTQGGGIAVAQVYGK
ncbi:MAG TPA: hypothetical protein VHS09_13250 [Polyangiaceae bacterium]|nr:hypothetical protein [Polyangiaceae bacterium]